MKVRKAFMIAIGLAVASAALAVPAESAISGIAYRAASSVRLSPSAERIDTKSDELSYTLTIRYAQDVDFEPDARAVLAKFASDLVQAGLNPASKKSIHVCGLQDGLKTPTGAPGVRLLGCAHYNPFTEAVSFEP